VSPEKNTNADEVQTNDTSETPKSSKRKIPSYNDAFIFKSEEDIQTKFSNKKEDIANDMYETPQSKSGSAKKRNVAEVTQDDDTGSLTHFIIYLF
jgi:hypothetical protein